MQESLLSVIKVGLWDHSVPQLFWGFLWGFFFFLNTWMRQAAAGICLLKCFCLCFCCTFRAKPEPKIPCEQHQSGDFFFFFLLINSIIIPQIGAWTRAKNWENMKCLLEKHFIFQIMQTLIQKKNTKRGFKNFCNSLFYLLETWQWLK